MERWKLSRSVWVKAVDKDGKLNKKKIQINTIIIPDFEKKTIG
jgi:hypothetical protein